MEGLGWWGGGGEGGCTRPCTCQSDSQGDIDGGEEPEEDDGEEAAHGEEDEGAPAVHNGPDEEEEAEEGADSQQRHCHRPPNGFDTPRTAHAHSQRVADLRFKCRS